MSYLSDRQRVEALLFPQMIWAIVEAGVPNPGENPDALECKRLLREASVEPLTGLEIKASEKVIRRTGRVHLEITAPYRKEGNRVDKVGLIVYFLIKSVTECGYMVIGQESNVQKAIDLFLPAIEDSASIEPLFNSARKQAAKVLEHLQRLGYFNGVPFSS